MKKLLLSLILIAAQMMVLFAQSGDLDPFFGTTFYNIEQDNRLFKTGEKVDLKTINGTPYETEKFVRGTAVETISENSGDFYMRYNIYNDAIEIKRNPQDKVATNLIKSENIYATINNKRYDYRSYLDRNNKRKSGYFILISSKGDDKLYLKKNKKFVPTKVSKEAYVKDTPAQFKDDNNYYFEIKNTLVLIPQKKKVFLKQFLDDEELLSKFLKKEKINLKKQEDLIRLLNYYSTIKKE